MSAKPTPRSTTRYRAFVVVGFALVVNGSNVGLILPPRVDRGWFWELNDSYSHGTAPTAQAAMDALVAAYEATGSEEAG